MRLYYGKSKNFSEDNTFYKVETLVKQKGIDYWHKGTTLRIAKRKKIGGFRITYRYFVTAVDAPAGQGAWLNADQFEPLSPLELLATAAEKPAY